MLAQDGLPECDQPEKNSLEILRHDHGNWTRATERTDSEIHSFSHWAIMTGHGKDRQWYTFIFPLSYHDRGHREDRQWDTLIFPLSYHDQGHGEDMQTVKYINFPMSHHDPGHGEDRLWDTFILPLSHHDPGHGEERQWDTFIFPLS